MYRESQPQKEGIQMEKLHQQLKLCVIAVVYFALTLFWYISGVLYPGVYYFGFATGVTALTEAVLFVCSLKQYAVMGVQWRTLLLTGLSGLGALASGYCLLIWLLVIF